MWLATATSHTLYLSKLSSALPLRSPWSRGCNRTPPLRMHACSRQSPPTPCCCLRLHACIEFKIAAAAVAVDPMEGGFCAVSTCHADRGSRRETNTRVAIMPMIAHSVTSLAHRRCCCSTPAPLGVRILPQYQTFQTGYFSIHPSFVFLLSTRLRWRSIVSTVYYH